MQVLSQHYKRPASDRTDRPRDVQDAHCCRASLRKNFRHPQVSARECKTEAVTVQRRSHEPYVRIAQAERGNAKRNERKPNRKREPVAPAPNRNQHARRKAACKLPAKLSRKEQPGSFVAERPPADENRQNRPQQHGDDYSSRKSGMDHTVRAAVMRRGVLKRGFDFSITSGS